MITETAVAEISVVAILVAFKTQNFSPFLPRLIIFATIFATGLFLQLSLWL